MSTKLIKLFCNASLGLSDPEDMNACDGCIDFERQADEETGIVAIIKGAGACRYDGNRYSGMANIAELEAKVYYGGEKGKNRNVFMKSCTMKGISHMTRIDRDFILFNIKTTADPELYIKYDCVIKE